MEAETLTARPHSSSSSARPLSLAAPDARDSMQVPRDGGMAQAWAWAQHKGKVEGQLREKGAGEAETSPVVSGGSWFI